MRILALVVVLFSLPAFAADHSPWSSADGPSTAGERLAQAPGTQYCIPYTGCLDGMHCCPAPQKPSCQNGVITKLPNGNSTCTMANCSCQ